MIMALISLSSWSLELKVLTRCPCISLRNQPSEKMLISYCMLFVLYLSSISLELSRDLLERQELNTCRIQTACIIIIFDGYTYSFKLGIAL